MKRANPTKDDIEKLRALGFEQFHIWDEPFDGNLPCDCKVCKLDEEVMHGHEADVDAI